MSFMEQQRERLKKVAGKSSGTKWLTLEIVLVTILLLVVMVEAIRVLRLWFEGRIELVRSFQRSARGA